MPRPVWSVALALLLTGCGAHLRHEVRASRAWVSSVDCTPGPLVVRTQTLGARWGESIGLSASGAPIRGVVAVKIGDQEFAAREFRPPDRADEAGNRYPVKVDNHRCVLQPGEAAPVVAAAAPAPTSDHIPGPAPAPAPPVYVPPPAVYAPPPPVYVPPPPVYVPAPAPASQPVAAPVAPPALPPPPPPTEPARLVEAPLPKAGHRTVVFEWTVEVRSLDGKGLEPGLPVEITVWSSEPNDLRDVVFELVQTALVPSPSEAEWIARLEKKEAKERARAEKRQREAEEETRHWNDCVNDREKKGCGDVRRRLRKGEEAEAKRQAAAEREAACRRNPEDAACAEWRERRRVAEERQREADRQQAHLEACRRAPLEPSCDDVRDRLRRDTPAEPPPAPPPEEPTPRPSEHAEWVPGAWVWSGFAWEWTAGGWRVPEIDRVQKKTVVAPAMPPPAQVEIAAPQRVPGAVWVPGYWMWTRVGWVWVRGVWRMPPRPAARWRPPAWIVDGHGVRLDPGGWILER